MKERFASCSTLLFTVPSALPEILPGLHLCCGIVVGAVLKQIADIEIHVAAGQKRSLDCLFYSVHKRCSKCLRLYNRVEKRIERSIDQFEDEIVVRSVSSDDEDQADDELDDKIPSETQIEDTETRGI
eukprot:TRINITY_DN24987_c0_g2_i1.p1 TRINITY_DN24987_c0_g2~~TRINITY_DN24987_c0_g2_i1.p1  ORF type:complete len:128 (-),score=25.84 TRINITY_DN24987_c0_g2_i1:390-773(-)